MCKVLITLLLTLRRAVWLARILDESTLSRLNFEPLYYMRYESFQEEVPVLKH